MKPLFWICGNQRESKQAFNLILDRVKENTGQDANVVSLICGPNPADVSGGWSTAVDVIHLLQVSDMFDSRPRIIKIFGLSDDYIDIADWLHCISDTNILVFYGPFGYTKIGSKQWVSGKASNLFKAIKTQGKIFEFDFSAKTISDAMDAVREMFEEKQKTIESSVVRRMVEIQGLNLDTLENMVNKICIYQKSATISLEDIEACCLSDYQDDVWSFLDHLDERNLDKSLAYLSSFYEEGDGGTGESLYGRISRLFGALLQHYHFLMMLKDICGDKINTQQLQKAIALFKKMTPTEISKLRAGTLKIEELAPRFSPQFVEMNIRKPSVQTVFKRKKSETYVILNDLYNCMSWSRKYSGNHAMLRLCLDSFVLRVCGVINSDEVKDLRGTI